MSARLDDISTMIAERTAVMSEIERVSARTQRRLDQLTDLCERHGWFSPPDLRLVDNAPPAPRSARPLATVTELRRGETCDAR